MAVTAETSGPMGKTNSGVLIDGSELAATGDGYSFYHSRERRYGSMALTNLVTDVAKTVAAAYPGSVLQVGDMSGKGGGRITGHSSHRTGQDVDLAFFVRNPQKSDTRDYLLALHDPYGVTVKDGHAAYFDYEKNWAVVEALLTSDKAQVQWIFVSKGLKARLLAYGLASGRDIDVLNRAASILHQPKDSAIHNDHFHVRIFCPPVETAPACVQGKPVWPWVNNPRKHSQSAVSDDRLYAMATEDL
ncbi:MAG: penicillin-insensitive murein endopeptidase [Deltaproteobacteria bacterium]|nr:penicillin-insensitive murein endopeptidase [Deltaproteobacteria bacterium]